MQTLRLNIPRKEISQLYGIPRVFHFQLEWQEPFSMSYYDPQMTDLCLFNSISYVPPIHLWSDLQNMPLDTHVYVFVYLCADNIFL